MNIADRFSQHQEAKIQTKKSSVDYRLRKLKSLRAIILREKEQIAKALEEDLGKAKVESYVTEVYPIISMINQSLKYLAKWMKPKKISTPIAFKGASSYIRYEGKGNCLVISPWNYPFQLSIYPVINSFICGNTTILKPSEFTPATNKVVDKILTEALEQREYAMFEGGVEVSTELLDKAFDHIFFTGSTPVGKIVMEAASKHLASVGLELGGKSPVFLDKKADVKEAMKKISWAKLINAGQTCVAPDYLLTAVDEKELVTEFNNYTKEAYNNEFDTNPDYCNIITPKHASRLKEIIDDAKAKGANILVGGEIIGERVITPTLISNVTSDMKIMQEEIFGPLLPVVKVSDVQDAVKYINKQPNPLAAYVFSDDRFTQDYFLDNTYSGGATVNDLMINVANVNLPFGGAGKSGIGNYHGHDGFLEFSNSRSVMDRRFDLGTSFLYPPYDKSKESVITKLFEKLSSFL